MLDDRDVRPNAPGTMDNFPIDDTAQPTDGDVTATPGNTLSVVGIGAGAGGLEAIQLLFGAMPADVDLAFVICRRVQSGLSDPLADLLCTQTAMPVVLAEEGTVLEAGRVHLVAPEARMILVKDRLVHFRPDAEDEAEAAASPIDILFHSLAVSAGSAAVAVMLSGSEADGERGCASIREHGGLVLAQHPESTEFAAMPRRVIDADLASAVAPPGAIADLIWRHVARTRQSEVQKLAGGRDDHALARIASLLEVRFAIDIDAYRPSLVARRVRRRLAMSKAVTLSDYADLLADDEDELSALHDDLLIRVTGFFRDPEAFAVLEREVLPELVEAMSKERPIRVWVPACASGEEAYSLAMLLLHRIEHAGKTPYLDILASDRYAPSLKEAHLGQYRRSSLGNVPSGLVERYMTVKDDIADVGPLLHRHVTFVGHDILKTPPPEDIDLVSCRNLLIYLAAGPREKALQACADAMRPGGFLFLGPSEQPSPSITDLATLHAKWRIYQKKTEARNQEALSKLAESLKQRPAETIEPPEVAGSEPRTPTDEPPDGLDGLMAENRRVLETTIDTLLASNDTLRRTNRDLRAENQRLMHAHAALDDVATMIAHDLKAPLRAVDRMAVRLKAGLAKDKSEAEADRLLQPLQHHIVAVNRMVDDLLNYARQSPADSADLHPVEIGALMRETLTLIGLPKGVRVMIKPPELTVMTWRIPLACILRNLLSQTIERIGDASGAIRIDATPSPRFLELSIVDNGQQKRDRSGELGLAIVRQLLDAAGGRLSLTSNDAGRFHHARLAWPIVGEVENKPKEETTAPA